MNYELIQYATSTPEWVTSWWMIAIVITLLAFTIGVGTWSAIVSPWNKADKVFMIGFFVSMIVVLSVGVWGISSKVHVSDAEKERVAVEVSEVAGQDVSADEVSDMLGGRYVPGVNYDSMTDSNDDKFLKVEVG